MQCLKFASKYIVKFTRTRIENVSHPIHQLYCDYFQISSKEIKVFYGKSPGTFRDELVTYIDLYSCDEFNLVSNDI